MVWEIREYGAVDDGRTVNTAVIQNTIDRCHQAGGGTVLIEGGVYLCGTIFLRSNVTLEIAQGTVLKANPDISDYAENTHHNRYRNEEALDRCFLYGEDLENIGICGKRTYRRQFGGISQQRQYLPPDADPFFAVPADTYRGHPISDAAARLRVLRFRVHLDQQSIYS